jgi:hypothetical protein
MSHENPNKCPAPPAANSVKRFAYWPKRMRDGKWLWLRYYQRILSDY